MQRHNADAVVAAAAAGAQDQNQIPNPTLDAKWGYTIMSGGYTAVPDVLLAHMGELGLSPTEMVVLLQILRFWWAPGRWPFPSKSTLAWSIGLTEKNIQKVIGRLVKGGYLTRIERRSAQDRSQSNCYDLSPLIRMLEPLAGAAMRARDFERAVRERERQALPQR